MSIINFEVEEVLKICENVIENSKIIVCSNSLIRIDIKQTPSRQITVCFRFPQNYPQQHLLIELKSRTLSTKFLEALTDVAEVNAKENLGKPQVLCVLKFIAQYLIQHPLCIVFDEILTLKTFINSTKSELKLKQKISSIILIAKGGKYFFKIKIEIPKEYPKECIICQDIESNLPAVLIRYLKAQAKEIARKCVEPPQNRIKDKKLKVETFKPTPSLMKTLKFVIETIKMFSEEICPVCKELLLPENPDEVIRDDIHPKYVERIYCGHLYHQSCLRKYMQEPPFPAGGKLCIATNILPLNEESQQQFRQRGNDLLKQCNLRIAHDRWAVNAKIAETRWAQKQAKQRELEEVVDFLQ